MRYTLSLMILTVISLLSVYIWIDEAKAQDAQEFAFQLRFRQELAAIRATRDTQDDAQFAIELLKVLEKEEFAPPLELRILEKVVSFGGSHPAGHASALKAIGQLKKLAPQRKREWIEGELDVNQKAFEAGGEDKPEVGHIVSLHMQLAEMSIDAGDYDAAMALYKQAGAFARKNQSSTVNDVDQRTRELREMIVRQQSADRLKADLAKLPGDKGTALKLIELYVYQVDDPAAAVEYLKIVNDPPLTAHVELAAKDYKTLDEAQCVKLATWYDGMGRDRQHPNRQGMLIRAKMYYERSLAMHADRDDAFDKRTRDLRSVDKELSRFGIGMKRARRLVKKLRGEDGRAKRDPRIDEALEKAVAYLYEHQDRETHWAPTKGSHAGGQTALVAYAMLMAEEDPRTNDSLRRAVQSVMKMEMRSTYSVCFRAHMWEMLPDNDQGSRVIKQDVGKLSRFMSSNGTIHYFLAPAKEADLSTTLAGFLTLWLGDISGMESAHTPWQKIVNQLARAQTSEGGWQYRADPARATTGGMTAAGLTILLMALDQEHLNDEDAATARECIERGMEWMDRNFDPRHNPNGGWHHYYLVAMQHVGLMSGRKKFKDLDWYESGSEHLLATQRDDGSWGAGNDQTIADTAFAVIFLARGGVEFDTGNPAQSQPAEPTDAQPEDAPPSKKKKPLPDLDSPVSDTQDKPAAEDDSPFPSKKR